MKILFLEPFFGGSHKDFATGFSRFSGHQVELMTLPARFWKWRMRGAALAFAERIKDISSFDLVFATDMMDITDLKALIGPQMPPLVLYFHENQLSYPLAPGEKRDFHLGFTNILSALAADAVLFNSRFHLDAFFRDAANLIQKMPDFRPSAILNDIQEKSQVLYPGCRFPAWSESGGPDAGDSHRPPLVVWNHRWEYDKNPEAFFRVLARLKNRGIRFSLAMLGERYDTVPDEFKTAKKMFKDEIHAWGYIPDQKAYQAVLKKGCLVVSCALQENFGISVMEAVRFGCFPLLPRRLSYPEIIPGPYHEQVLYTTEEELAGKMESHLLAEPHAGIPGQHALSRHAARFSWEAVIDRYDGIMEAVGTAG